LRKIAKESGGQYINLASAKNLSQLASNMITTSTKVIAVTFEDLKKFDEDFGSYNEREKIQVEIFPKQPLEISNEIVILTGKMKNTDRGIFLHFPRN
jgi:hypothetical protein